MIWEMSSVPVVFSSRKNVTVFDARSEKLIEIFRRWP